MVDAVNCLSRRYRGGIINFFILADDLDTVGHFLTGILFKIQVFFSGLFVRAEYQRRQAEIFSIKTFFHFKQVH